MTVTITNGTSVAKADAKMLRIPRPYGGAVVFEAESKRGLAAFFKRATEWFDRAPSDTESFPLSLFPDEPTHARELAAFQGEAKSWSFTGDVRVSYEAPSKALDEHLPPPVLGRAYPVHAGIERRAVSSFVIHLRANEAVEQSEHGMVVTYQERSQFVDVELRHPAIAKVRDAATAISGVAEDVLDVLIANAFQNPANTNGIYSIEIDAILDARGVRKKSKTDGKKTYTAGHHEQARQDVAKALVELDKLWVAGGDRNASRRGRRPANAWQRVFKLELLFTAKGGEREQRDRATLDELDPKQYVAIDYSFGVWFDSLRATTASIQAPRRLLELNAKNAGPAKDLGRHLIQRRSEAEHDGRLVRSIGKLFEDLVWRPTPGDPGETRARLERALTKLKGSGIISTWEYVEDVSALPPRRWLDIWMEYSIWVRF